VTGFSIKILRAPIDVIRDLREYGSAHSSETLMGRPFAVLLNKLRRALLKGYSLLDVVLG